MTMPNSSQVYELDVNEVVTTAQALMGLISDVNYLIYTVGSGTSNRTETVNELTLIQKQIENILGDKETWTIQKDEH